MPDYGTIVLKVHSPSSSPSQVTNTCDMDLSLYAYVRDTLRCCGQLNNCSPRTALIVVFACSSKKSSFTSVWLPLLFYVRRFFSCNSSSHGDCGLIPRGGQSTDLLVSHKDEVQATMAAMVRKVMSSSPTRSAVE
jgi:hypothetical protein